MLKGKIMSMKERNKALLVIGAVILLFAGLYVLSRSPKIGPIENIDAFHFEYSDVNDENYTTNYVLVKNEDSSYTARIVWNEGDRQNPTTQEFTVGADFAQRVEELLVKNHVRWWQGIYASALKGVGYQPYIGSCGFSMENGEWKDSTFFSKKPWRYKAVKNGVIEIYSELLE